MTQTVILHGPKARLTAQQVVEGAPEGSVVRVDPPKRSLDQNAKMQAMLSDVSRAKPQGRELPPEIWKALFMAEAGFKPRFEVSLDGNGVVPIGYKSSRLNKAEFSDLIEAIYAFGAEHDVLWSDPAQWDGSPQGQDPQGLGAQHDSPAPERSEGDAPNG